MQESKYLEKVRTALANSAGNADIKTLLARCGFGEAEHAVGQKKYDSTHFLWENHKKEEADTAGASAEYKAQYSDVAAVLKRHRDNARELFRKDPVYLMELGVQGAFPSKYNELFDAVSRFYNCIKTNDKIQQRMARINITPEVADTQLKALAVLKDLRSKFDAEAAESHDATETKNSAMIDLKEWMDEFYAIARIALYDHPQLLEALGLSVRS